MTARRTVLGVLGLAAALTARAACLTDQEAAVLLAHYADLRPYPNPPAELTLADAVCGREQFTRLLTGRYGRVIGYKAALTNPVIARQFGADQPVRGVLFERMLLPDGATVPARYGTRPQVEADLLVQVKDPGIHEAQTPLEVLQHLTHLYPFVELADGVVADPRTLTAAGIVLINAGARLGVRGAAVPVDATPALVAALATMTVKVVTADGRELERGQGSAILGQPLQAVIWLARDLTASGIRLQAGDLLSLGALTRPLTPEPGLELRVIYEGVPGLTGVTVRFQ